MRCLVRGILALSLFGCSEQIDETYATYADAERAGAIERGWLPAFVPRSARNLEETHDLDITELEDRLRRATGAEPLVFDSGPETIRSVGIVTGGGAFAIGEAATLGLDALVTGEPSEPALAESRESGIHFLAGGHHATETFGVRGLGELVAEQFGVEHGFIEIPNPV